MKELVVKKKKSAPAIWLNKKFKDRPFQGSYAVVEKKDGTKKRAFVISGLTKSGKPYSDIYESHEDAKKDGWYRL